MSIALSTLDFLQNDDDYVPWRAMSRELTYLDQMLRSSAQYGLFEVSFCLLYCAEFELKGNVWSLDFTLVSSRTSGRKLKLIRICMLNNNNVI